MELDDSDAGDVASSFQDVQEVHMSGALEFAVEAYANATKLGSSSPPVARSWDELSSRRKPGLSAAPSWPLSQQASLRLIQRLRATDRAVGAVR